MSEKKRYLITVDVKQARGSQQFAVEAETPEEAVALFNAGEGEYVSEEIEVVDLHPVSLENVEEDTL